MRRRLLAITLGAPIAPLVVLFGLNFVDELDRIAFHDPQPGDRRHVRAHGRPGHLHRHAGRHHRGGGAPDPTLANRFNRVRLVAFAALTWMALSVLTGLAGWGWGCSAC